MGRFSIGDEVMVGGDAGIVIGTTPSGAYIIRQLSTGLKGFEFERGPLGYTLISGEPWQEMSHSEYELQPYWDWYNKKFGIVPEGQHSTAKPIPNTLPERATLPYVNGDYKPDMTNDNSTVNSKYAPLPNQPAGTKPLVYPNQEDPLGGIIKGLNTEHGGLIFLAIIAVVVVIMMAKKK